MKHFFQKTALIYFLFSIKISRAFVIKQITPQIGQYVDLSSYNAHNELSRSGSYSYGYDVQDLITNNIQYKNEVRHPNGTVTGSYGYVEPDGNIHLTHYVADAEGYRAVIEDSDRAEKIKTYPFMGSQKERNYQVSPQMLAALESRKLFRIQSPFENRLRPVSNMGIGTNYLNSKIETIPLIPILHPKYHK